MQSRFRILRAEHLGMCFGVRDAIALAKEEVTRGPVTILGDLVHNPAVNAELKSRGIHIAKGTEEIVPSTVMITAHGASQKRLNEVMQKGLRVVEGTCPLVKAAHKAIIALVREGFHPVIVGRRDHVEVRGMTEDLDTYDVVLEDADIDQLSYRDRFGIASQTTQPINRVHYLSDRLKTRFPDAKVRLIDTVCQPTKLRQSAAIALAAQVDVVIVVGGPQSNNTRELAATCGMHCDRVYQVQGSADLRSVWFRGDETVGITAGTSTPDRLIDEVHAWLEQFREFQERIQPPEIE